MRIAVCIKQVPDPQAPAGSFYVDEAANEPRWSPPAQDLISTFDLHAIEAAAQIRETAGGYVTILTLGPPSAEVALRRALAGGGDEAVRVDEALAPGGDRFAVATVLAAAIRRLGGVDLVLCGRIAADWDMGHVPGMLAQLLGMPAITPARAIRVTGEGVVVERVTVDGYEVVEARLPCLVAVSNEANEPRYPTMRTVIEAQRKPVETWTADVLGAVASHAPAVRLARLAGRDLSRACEFVEGSSAADAGSALASLLHEKGLV